MRDGTPAAPRFSALAGRPFDLATGDLQASRSRCPATERPILFALEGIDSIEW